MNTKHLILGAAVAGAVCGLDAKTVIYSNDFSTRTSVVRAEPGPWSTYAYTVGARLAYSYSASWYNYSPDIHWSDPTQIQDGWVQGAAGGYQEEAGHYFPGSYVRVNNEDECPGDTTHPFGAFRFNALSHTWCRVLQPIGNSFSNGVVRYAVDMRPPQVWGATKYGGWGPLFRFYPAFQRDLRHPEIGDNTEENPCAIGFAQNTATDSPGNALVQGAKRNLRYGTENNFYGTVEPGHWYRCHVTIDIDRATCFMSMDDMGGAVPSWDSAPVQADVLRMDTERSWRFPMTPERGPIDGIAFQVEGVNSMDVVTNMPSFTNIKVEWKAPGTDTFLSCYENDFIICRKRTLQPPAPTFTYPEITTATAFAANDACARGSLWGADHLPDRADTALLVTKPLNSGESVEAVGFDNWRRIYCTGWAFATVANYDGNHVLRASWPYGPGDEEGVYGCFAQPLGETLTSGKVRMLADMRTPARFWYTANSGLYVCFGDANHHSSYGGGIDGSQTTYVSLAGIGCGGETLCYPEWKTANSWPNAKGDFTCETSRWYRVETVVDLDARTWGFSIFDLEGGAPEQPVFTRTGLAYAHPAAQPNIAAFSISAYGAGYDADGVMLYDNIQVWKNWNEQEGTGDEIYRNDFTTRTRPSVRMAESLGDAPNVTSDETDRWTIRGGDADWVKRVKGENGNPCASFFCQNCNTHPMQDFGTSVRTGKLTVSADVRPPSVWHTGGVGRDVGVYVGGPELAQGNLFANAEIWKAAATGFGFDGGGAPWNAAQVSHLVTAYCQDGLEARRFGFTTDPSHWYRFKATFDLKTRKVRVNVHDMGAGHPELDTPDGTLVGLIENLAFVNDQVEELTTVCLRGVGLRTDKPWMAEDAGSAFFDNLKAEFTPLGCSIIVR